jgi:hypothetical protein
MRILLLTTLIYFFFSAAALAAPCQNMKLDLDKGTLNGIPLTASLAQVKKAFPCPHTQSGQGKNISLYFAAAGFSFQPGQSISVNNLEEPGFQGTLSKAILGLEPHEIDEILGAYQYFSRIAADESMGYYYRYAFYARPWGTLILKYDYYSPSHVEEVLLTTEKLAQLKKQYPQK